MTFCNCWSFWVFLKAVLYLRTVTLLLTQQHTVTLNNRAINLTAPYRWAPIFGTMNLFTTLQCISTETSLPLQQHMFSAVILLINSSPDQRGCVHVLLNYTKGNKHLSVAFFFWLPFIKKYWLLIEFDTGKVSLFSTFFFDRINSF